VAETLFYVLSAVALAGAAGVVLAKSPMQSVLSLLASFFALAVIYLLAGFQFLAAAQVLVYAGAILVLFLFVIMLLDLAHLDPRHVEMSPVLHGRRARLALILALALGLAGLIAAQRAQFPAPAPPAAGIDDLEAIALLLFSRYALPFEAASLLLLATMAAVIVLAKRQGRARGAGAAGDAAEPGTSSGEHAARPAELEESVR